ncbi:MAG TPA: septal ring lytic transglycosylase RlpA family protein [Allocoleopsis sp.]
MPLFGLFWISSWVSCLLASSQNLFKVPDHLGSVFPARVLSAIGSPLETPPSKAFPTPLSTGVWSSISSATTIPNLAFQSSASGSPFHPQQVQFPNHPLGFGTPKSTLCSPQGEPQENTLTVAKIPSSSTPSWTASLNETSPPKVSDGTFSQQIMQVIKNLLPWRQSDESVGKSLAASVRVVSTHSWEQVDDPANTKKPLVKQGLWRYSQLLASRAFAAVPSKGREQFQVWLKGRVIAQLTKQEQANLMAKRLKQILLDSSESVLNTANAEPGMIDNLPAVKIGDRILIKIDDKLATDVGRNAELLAIEWTNNLRITLGKVALPLAEAQKRMHNLAETPKKFDGLASWYGPQFHGRPTATGETYNQHELTAAHPFLPFNTYLKVKNLKNGDSVVVRINDRGPYVSDPNRNLDLSQEAARCLNSEKVGVIPFEAIIMQPPSAR